MQNKYLIWFLANALWFGFFFVAVLLYHWTPWSLVVPVFFHWRIKEIV